MKKLLKKLSLGIIVACAIFLAQHFAPNIIQGQNSLSKNYKLDGLNILFSQSVFGEEGGTCDKECWEGQYAVYCSTSGTECTTVEDC